MSEPPDPHQPPEPHDGIDAAAAPEARAYEADQIQPLSRAAGEGAPPTEAPPAGQAPAAAGTGAGDPLDGVRADPEDVAEAVPGDEGPEHPGVGRTT